jgi:hypothetical protein
MWGSAKRAFWAREVRYPYPFSAIARLGSPRGLETVFLARAVSLTHRRKPEARAALRKTRCLHLPHGQATARRRGADLARAVAVETVDAVEILPASRALVAVAGEFHVRPVQAGSIPRKYMLNFPFKSVEISSGALGARFLPPTTIYIYK